MSDPQDLLYTNEYVNSNILNKNEIANQNQYYQEYQDFVDNNSTSDIKGYVNDDLYEDSEVNHAKNLNTKWPPESNKNQYPLFDKFIGDVSENRYKKETITRISVNSENRNVIQYPNPNYFSIDFTKKFNSIKKIVINDIVFPNFTESVSNYNNNLSWQYVSNNYLVNFNIDAFIIPVPNIENPILYSLLPYSCYQNINNFNISDENFLVYQCSVQPGFYTVPNFISNIKYNTAKILHTKKNNVIENPYYSFSQIQETPHLFSLSVDTNTSVVRFVNRMEEIEIIAIQTFSQFETDFINNDIFNFYSSNPSTTLDTSLYYITLNYIEGITTAYSNSNNALSAFPLVITNLDIEEIPSSLFNYTEFYDLNIYLSNNYSESNLDSICTYKYIDTITINNKKYIRFGFKLSNGNLNGSNYSNNGQIIKPMITQNLILNKSLNKYFLNVIDTINYDFISNKTNINTFIGRALLFRWIFDKDNGHYVNYEVNTINEKKRSLLSVLAWPIANQTEDKIAVTPTNGFRFVHTNTQGYIIDKNQINYPLLTINYPQKKLTLQYESNNYYIISSNYVYLKLDFNINENNISQENIINAIEQINLQYNQNYIESIYFNVGIGEDYTCLLGNNPNIKLYPKNQTNIFAKILVGSYPGNTDILASNIVNNSNFSINYDFLFDNISGVIISVYDSQLRLLNLFNNFSFTMNIHEIKDILKETLINTKTNSVNSTGSFM